MLLCGYFRPLPDDISQYNGCDEDHRDHSYQILYDAADRQIGIARKQRMRDAFSRGLQATGATPRPEQRHPRCPPEAAAREKAKKGIGRAKRRRLEPPAGGNPSVRASDGGSPAAGDASSLAKAFVAAGTTAPALTQGAKEASAQSANALESRAPKRT